MLGLKLQSQYNGFSVPVTMAPIMTPPPPPSPAPTVLTLGYTCRDEEACKQTCEFGFTLGHIRGDGCRPCICNERMFSYS